jgi:hypothetical protein
MVEPMSLDFHPTKNWFRCSQASALSPHRRLASSNACSPFMVNPCWSLLRFDKMPVPSMGTAVAEELFEIEQAVGGHHAARTRRATWGSHSATPARKSSIGLLNSRLVLSSLPKAT